MENADGTRWQSFSLVLGNSYERENLEIQIIDVNDNIPIFQPMRSYFNVSEVHLKVYFLINYYFNY